MAQVALATILLVTAGLMTRSLRALLDTDLGFQPNGVIALRLSSIDTSVAARVRRQQAIDAVMQVRGVRSVSMSQCVPFDLACLVTVGVRGVNDADGNARAVELEYHPATPGYFRTMGIPIVAGRALVAEDTTVGRTRVVISEAAARRLFGTEAAAIGKQIVFNGDRALPMDVVGVARNVRFRSVDAAETPALYRIVGEDVRASRLTSTLFVRTSSPTGIAISSVTRALRESGAPLGVSDAQPLVNVVRSVTSSTRFIATLLLGFAASAVLLAGLGIYGVIAFIVSQRAREFGVRLVLGADGRRLLGSVVRRGAGLVGVGVVAGAILAVGATRIVRSLLYGVGSFDAATYLVVALIVSVTGLLATFIPARRIAYIDPADALRG
jgi:predicted permease